MIAQGDGGVWPYIELAKYYEHIVRDIPRALHYANGALSYALNAAPLRGVDDKEMDLIRRRIARLREKQKKASHGGVGEED